MFKILESRCTHELIKIIENIGGLVLGCCAIYEKSTSTEHKLLSRESKFSS